MGKIWTILEDSIIKKMYRTASWVRLENSLPGRTRNAIKARARILNIVRDSYRLGKRALYAYCNVHGSIHRTEIIWKEGKSKSNKKKPVCPRPFCNRQLRLVPKNSRQKRRYIDLGLMEELKSETKQEL